MKAKLINEEGQKEETLSNELPPVDDQAGDEGEEAQNVPRGTNQEPDKNREDELLSEIKTLRSEMETIKRSQPPVLDAKEQQEIQTKQILNADMGNLDDDDFIKKYRMNKLQASTTLIQYETDKERQKSSTRIAELEAKSELASKYTDFNRFYDKVKGVVSDLSPESRQSPEKVRAAMEREYHYLLSQEKPRAQNGTRRHIVTDFAPPTPKTPGGKPVDKDEIDPEYRGVCERMGITKESERKKWMNPWIPTNLGTDMNGFQVIIDDPSGKPKRIKAA